MDIDLEICSKLLNISVLVLFRTKYGSTAGKEGVKRGELDDLVISSTLYACENTLRRPCILLYRDVDKTYAKYSALTMTTGSNNNITRGNTPLYSRADMLPSDVLNLIKYHLEQSKDH